MDIRVRMQDKWYKREEVAADTNAVYLFGDNYKQQGTDVVPSATQAVIRGLPNAIGIPTKHDQYTGDHSYLSDKDLPKFKRSTIKGLMTAIRSGKIIVVPADGIGTGSAQLSNRAPQCAAYIFGVLNTLWLISLEY